MQKSNQLVTLITILCVVVFAAFGIVSTVSSPTRVTDATPALTVLPIEVTAVAATSLPATIAPTVTLLPTETSSPTAVPTTPTATQTPVSTLLPTSTVVITSTRIATNTVVQTTNTPLTARPSQTIATIATTPTSPTPSISATPASIAPTIVQSGIQTVPPNIIVNASYVAQPNISSRHRQIWLASKDQGKDLARFSVVGDCNSMPSVYLQRVANGTFNIDRYVPSLRATQNYFGNSFRHVSFAANGGFTSAAMNDPVWADGANCGTQQTPFECEIFVNRASIVFIQVGTGDQYTWRVYEPNLRRMVDTALKKGVLPVLLTKADNLETVQGGAPADFINNMVRKVARDFDVPLIDFYTATRQLPNNGLFDEGDLDFHLSDAGMDLHLLLTLQALDKIWRG